MSVTIRHVISQTGHVSAYVDVPNGGTHHVGHIPGDGWFCTCSKATRCKQINLIRDLVDDTALARLRRKK